ARVGPASHALGFPVHFAGAWRERPQDLLELGEPFAGVGPQPPATILPGDPAAAGGLAGAFRVQFGDVVVDLHQSVGEPGPGLLLAGHLPYHLGVVVVLAVGV